MLSCLYFQALAPDDLCGCGLFCYPSSWVKPPLSPPPPLKHTRIQNHGDDTPFQQLCARPYEMGQWKSLHLQNHHQCISLFLPLFGSLSLPLSPRLSEGSSGQTLPALTCVSVLPGWAAGLRGGALQHGPHAGQQHPRPEEDDVVHGTRAPVQFWEPPEPLPSEPQPPRTPGPPWSGPPQPPGTPLKRQLSPPGETLRFLVTSLNQWLRFHRFIIRHKVAAECGRVAAKFTASVSNHRQTNKPQINTSVSSQGWDFYCTINVFVYHHRNKIKKGLHNIKSIKASYKKTQ